MIIDDEATLVCGSISLRCRRGEPGADAQDWLASWVGASVGHVLQPLKVSFTNTRVRLYPHERIAGLGGITEDGRRWYVSHEQAIADISEGRAAYVIAAEGADIPVEIATHHGHVYLKGAIDSVEPESLIRLAR